MAADGHPAPIAPGRAGAPGPWRALVQLPRRLLAGLVRAYQLLFSAWLGNVCRYAPSCSHYALQALNRHGALGGTALATWRVLRCNPWGSSGYDPVEAFRWPWQSTAGDQSTAAEEQAEPAKDAPLPSATSPNGG